MVEYLVTFFVDKFHQSESYLEGEISAILKHLFDILKDIFCYKIFSLFFGQDLFFEVIVAY